MRKGLRSLGDVLSQEKARKTSLSRMISLAEAAVSWQRNMSGHFATRSAVHSIKDSTLYISVEEPAWAQQMSMMKGQILARFSESCSLEWVKDIRFGTFGSMGPEYSPSGDDSVKTEGPPTKADLDDAGRMILDKLGSRMHSEARKVLESNLENETFVSEGAMRRCAACSLPVAKHHSYCAVCSTKPYPDKLAEAVSCLIDCPLAEDVSIIAACGLDEIEDTYAILSSARQIAGRRLVDEAVKAFAEGKDTKQKERAKPLLVASACAYNNIKPEDVDKAGLESFFPRMLLEDLGIV